jgi:hypothetical protein
MLNPLRSWRAVACVVAGSAVLAACSTKTPNPQNAAGTLDTAALRTNGAPAAAGPAVQVTRTDAKSVSRATQFELTTDNFARFLAAADSIVALEARSPAVRAYLGKNIADAPSPDADAGLKWLEANTAVSRAISSAGISVKDYFVESIAIADADRFIANPGGAPPTPALGKNAEFLRSHEADVERLKALREGKPVVTVTP